MSERAKRRKSLWDSKEEHPFLAQISQKDAWRGKESYYGFHASDDSKLSDLEATNVLKSEKLSLQRTRELSQGNSDGQGRRNPCSPENSWGKSYRYNRGRSSSLDRDGGRSRSRSRDRDVSRSPFGDHRAESYQSSDRRNGLGISSRLCIYFAAGNCRRGKQCRFLHLENLSHRDGEQLERDQTERWTNTREHRENYYSGEKDGLLRNSIKPTLLCNDFLEGMCQKGSSCRYPHHDASGDNCQRGNRNMLTDKDYRSQLHENTPCHYFMMGKCRTDNCKFSHDCISSGNFEGRSWLNGQGHDLDDMKKSWNGPKWSKDVAVSVVARPNEGVFVGNGTFVDQYTDQKHTDNRYNLDEKNEVRNCSKQGDGTSVSKIAKSTGFSKYSVENIKLTDPTNAEKFTTDRQDGGLDSESGVRECSAQKDKAPEGEESMSPDWVGGSHLVQMGITGSKDVTKLSLAAHSLQGQTSIGLSKDVHEWNIMREPSSSEISQIPLHQGKVVENIARTDDSSSVVNGVNSKGNPIHPVLVPGKLFNQNAESFSSQPRSLGGIDHSQHMISINPSNEHNIDPRGPVQHNSSFDLQNPTQVHDTESVKTLMNSGNTQNVGNLEQAMQIASLAASLTQVFGNGQLHQLYAALNSSVCAELGPALSKPVTRHPNGLIGMQLDQTNESHKCVLGNSLDPCISDDCDGPPGFSSSCIEQKNQIHMEHLSPSSTVGPDSGNSELKDRKPIANSVVEEESKSMAEKCKSEWENMKSENVDTDGKVGEGSNGKDEKALRLFKNALVEFVKEVLKPKWKEGQINREVHKAIVKKVVDKVTSTFHGDNIPKTQNKVEQYLSFSRSKLTKLVEAYMERFLKSS